MRPARTVLVGGLAALLLGGSARADEVIGPRRNVPPVSHARSGLVAVKRGLQAPEGMLHTRVLLHINASKGLFAKPISLAPDLWYGITDSLQVGILHNGPMGWQTRPGPGLCLTGKDGGCPKVYDNIGLDALYGLAFGDFHFSLHSSFFVLSFSDPTPMMLTLGAAAKFHFGDKVALFVDPQFGIALNHRDVNKDKLFLPVELQFQAQRALSVKLLTGVEGPLSGFGDNYRIPLGLGAIYSFTESFDLGLRFSFDNLLGKVPPGAERTDERSISLLMHLRWE